MCDPIVDNATALRIEVDEHDWCYVSIEPLDGHKTGFAFSILQKSHILGILICGSPGRTCHRLHTHYYCCMGHLCNGGQYSSEVDFSTIGLTIFANLLIRYMNYRSR